MSQVYLKPLQHLVTRGLYVLTSTSKFDVSAQIKITGVNETETPLWTSTFTDSQVSSHTDPVHMVFARVFVLLVVDRREQ